jgi:hypothetical protein
MESIVAEPDRGFVQVSPAMPPAASDPLDVAGSIPSASSAFPVCNFRSRTSVKTAHEAMPWSRQHLSIS